MKKKALGICIWGRTGYSVHYVSTYLFLCKSISNTVYKTKPTTTITENKILQVYNTAKYLLVKMKHVKQ